NRERILIGRDELCDIRIASHLVSRHHALVVNSSQGVKLVDLGSTNGTFVDGRKIKQCALQDSQVITIGDCTIEYVAGDDQQAGFGDMDPTEKFEQDNTGPASPGKGLGSEMQLLELEPAKTKISSGRRRARR
ncbi:MAG: FHA domain-containing protein, partial [Pseudomonadales bacterium]